MITDTDIDRAAEVIYNDFFGARVGELWETLPDDAIIKIQCRATAKAAVNAALKST
jgi:hypothetical protein